jgi:hypothetical protein
MSKNERRGLGRGLSALMADVHLPGPDQMASARKAEMFGSGGEAGAEPAAAAPGLQAG